MVTIRKNIKKILEAKEKIENEDLEHDEIYEILSSLIENLEQVNISINKTKEQIEEIIDIVDDYLKEASE